MRFTVSGTRLSTLFAAILVAVVICATAGPASALIIKNYSAGTNVFPGGSITSGLDFTGIGWTETRMTLVSDHYFISAAHSPPSVGATPFFRDSGGTQTQVTIASGSTVSGTDIWVGRLLSAAPSNIPRYSILDLGAAANWVGQTVLNFGPGHGQPRVIGNNVIDFAMNVSGTSGITALVTDDRPNGESSETMFEASDSGRPSFIVHNGNLTLLGAHYFTWTDSQAGTQGGGDTILALYIDEINALMGTERLSVIPIPEPTSILLLGAGLLGAALWRRRRRAD